MPSTQASQPSSQRRTPAPDNPAEAERTKRAWLKLAEQFAKGRRASLEQLVRAASEGSRDEIDQATSTAALRRELVSKLEDVFRCEAVATRRPDRCGAAAPLGPKAEQGCRFDVALVEDMFRAMFRAHDCRPEVVAKVAALLKAEQAAVAALCTAAVDGNPAPCAQVQGELKPVCEATSRRDPAVCSRSLAPGSRAASECESQARGISALVTGQSSMITEDTRIATLLRVVLGERPDCGADFARRLKASKAFSAPSGNAPTR
jgi:hypothetical protein